MKEKLTIPRLVIAGTHSNVGKTTITCALARHFKEQGYRVRIFKCGPDYLDPTYHGRASGETSVNLDSWMMGKESVKSTFLSASKGFDIALIEGVMGLYDGVTPTKETGSTAEIAKILGAPVILVCDTSGMSRSIAPLAQGFINFDPDLNIAGVICNRIGSENHLKLLIQALGPIKCFGGVKKGEKTFPGRHLGLTTASEDLVPDDIFEYWAKFSKPTIHSMSLLEEAKKFAPVEVELDENINEEVKCKIAYAKDPAFHFYYEENLNLLKSFGAKLIPFSPLNDTELPENIDGIIIGGGYPEIHADALSRNTSMIKSLKDFAKNGGPIYGECGGLMYLTKGIQTSDGNFYEMLGLLPGQAIMEGKLKALGYVEVETKKESLLGPKGMRFRGHQFRYSTLDGIKEEDELCFSLRKRRNKEVSKEGYIKNNILGSYVHAHWGSNNKIPKNFVDCCQEYRNKDRSLLR